jgi:hypothetical protein
VTRASFLIIYFLVEANEMKGNHKFGLQCLTELPLRYLVPNNIFLHEIIIDEK